MYTYNYIFIFISAIINNYDVVGPRVIIIMRQAHLFIDVFKYIYIKYVYYSPTT